MTTCLPCAIAASAWRSPAAGWPVHSTTTSMRGSAISAIASSTSAVVPRAAAERRVERRRAVALLRPADPRQRLPRAGDGEVGDARDVQPRRARRHGQEHGAELAGADHAHRHRALLGGAGAQHAVQVHGGSSSWRLRAGVTPRAARATPGSPLDARRARPKPAAASETGRGRDARRGDRPGQHGHGRRAQPAEGAGAGGHRRATRARRRGPSSPRPAAPPCRAPPTCRTARRRRWCSWSTPRRPRRRCSGRRAPRPRLAPGAVLIVSATMAPDDARRLAARAEAARPALPRRAGLGRRHRGAGGRDDGDGLRQPRRRWRAPGRCSTRSRRRSGSSARRPASAAR